MAYYKSAHCVIEGAVEIGADANIWHYAVVRGDEDSITIGARTNVQDGAVLHVDEGWPLSVGSGITIGHRAVVHGCTIEDDVLVGMGAIIMNGAAAASSQLAPSSQAAQKSRQILSSSACQERSAPASAPSSANRQ